MAARVRRGAQVDPVGPREVRGMDSATFLIRPLTDSDHGAMARIENAINPRTPITADEIRHWVEALRIVPGRPTVRLSVEDRRSGEMVAFGQLSHDLFGFHPREFWVGVSVDLEHRRQGIGQEVYSRLEREALPLQAASLRSGIREDDEGAARFLARQGFVPRRKLWNSRLDLTQVDLSTFPDRSESLGKGGFRFTTLAEEGTDRADVRERLYHLSLASSKDVPRIGKFRGFSQEEFEHADVEGPKVLPDAVFLAAYGNEFVGWTTLTRELASPDTLGVGFTGTHPEYRGRGIASELKRRAVEYARSHGYRYLITTNDSLNPRIWAINQKLGFHPETTWVQAEKLLPAEPT